MYISFAKRPPVPFGANDLCPVKDRKSICMFFTSMSVLPIAYAASVWKYTPLLSQISPIAFRSWNTPISLFIAIIETKSVFSFMTDLRWFKSTRPYSSTSITVTSNPNSFFACSIASKTVLCSIWVVIKWFFDYPDFKQALHIPKIAALFDSVAPEVNTISRLSAFKSYAIFLRASSTALSLSAPNTWPFECGLPYSDVKNGSILSKTRKSIGVVACMSKYIGRRRC